MDQHSAASAAPVSSAQKEQGMTEPETPLARVQRWLQAWDGHGVHRTGTAGDEAGAAWLAGEVERLGAEAASEEWEFDRLEPIACFVDIDGVRIEGVPVFDALATGADGIEGEVGPAGSTATIGVFELAPQAVYSGAFETLRRGARHEALVIVCRGARPGLGLINAERFGEPYGAPAIHVSSEAREEVLSAAALRRQRPARRRQPPRAGRCPQHRCDIARPAGRAVADRGHDPAQFMVAIDRRTRRRAGVLARELTRAGRRAAGLRGGVYRQ
jgi:hypothetical protein